MNRVPVRRPDLSRGGVGGFFALEFPVVLRTRTKFRVLHGRLSASLRAVSDGSLQLNVHRKNFSTLECVKIRNGRAESGPFRAHGAAGVEAALCLFGLLASKAEQIAGAIEVAGTNALRIRPPDRCPAKAATPSPPRVRSRRPAKDTGCNGATGGQPVLAAALEISGAVSKCHV